MYIKVSIIVQKGAPGLHKDYFWGQFRDSIFKLGASKMFNFTPSCNWEEVPIMMVLRVILKGILKAYFNWLVHWWSLRVILESLK